MVGNSLKETLKKEALRKKMKSALASISPFVRESKDRVIGHFLQDFLGDFFTRELLPRGQAFLKLGVFSSLKDEVHWSPSLEDCDFMKTSYPYFMGEGEMVFKESTEEELISCRDFGVTLKCPKELAPTEVPDICLVPGLAFSRVGERLGRGGGFYDRYLKNFSGLKIGIAYKEQILEHIPCDEHDIILDRVVSEEGVF